MTVKKGAAISAGVIGCCVAFTPLWEGMDTVARPDAIGTGHPLTFCFGSTPNDDPSVRAGQHFTKQECDKRLADSLPKYLSQIKPCIRVALPEKTEAALLDAAYNAGPAAVCKSPMLKKMNAGDLVGGCNAFDGWYIRSDGKVRTGLIARRSGDKSRKGEKQLCLEGLTDKPTPKPVAQSWWQKFLSIFIKGN